MSRDALEVLAALSPLSKLNESLPGDEAMLATITAITPITVARRRRVLWSGLGFVLVTGAAAAFAFLRQDTPSSPARIVCYTDAAVPPAGSYVLDVSPDPVEACADLWRNGVIATRDAPQLAACINDAGTIVVVPGDKSVCADLEFANWVGEFTAEDLRVIEFDKLVTEWFGAGCVGHFDATTDAQRFVDDFGVEGWVVVDAGNWSPERPCAAAGVDPVRKQVTVGGRRPGPDDQPSTTTTEKREQ